MSHEETGDGVAGRLAAKGTYLRQPRFPMIVEGEELCMSALTMRDRRSNADTPSVKCSLILLV